MKDMSSLHTTKVKEELLKIPAILSTGKKNSPTTVDIINHNESSYRVKNKNKNAKSMQYGYPGKINEVKREHQQHKNKSYKRDRHVVSDDDDFQVTSPVRINTYKLLFNAILMSNKEIYSKTGEIECSSKQCI